MTVRRILASLSLVLIACLPTSAQAPADPLAEATVQKNLEYGPHERNKLDLAVPKRDGPFPLLVWIHGGGWAQGDKNGFGVLKSQVTRGYAVASINYRFSKHAPFPAQLLDVKAAIRFLRTNAAKYKLDPDRVGVSGASAGGHLAALLGTSNGVKGLDADDAKPALSRVHAVIDFFGPADLMKLSPAGAKENAVSKLLGGDSGVKNDLAKAGTPQTHADKSDPPMLIVHGDADRLVPLSQSEEFHAALKKAGVESELVIVKGGGHDAGIFTKEVNEKMNEFWDRHLKSGKPKVD